MRSISSRQNPVVHLFRSLAQTPDPTGARLLLDGLHLVRDAQAAGLSLEIAVVDEEQILRDREIGELVTTLDEAGVDVIAAPRAVLDAISPVRTPSGIAAIARHRLADADALCRPAAPFLLVIVDVQDPGNVGALLRVAEAAGVTGAFVCGESAHPFSWKALRGSMGSALRVPLVAGVALDRVLQGLARHGIRTVASIPRSGRDPDAIDWTGAVALLVGGEGPGLSDAVIGAAAARVTIPMAPTVESLNVSTAAAILLYAARRQRT